MAQSLDRLKESASQTAGPYVHIGLTPNFCGIGGVYPARSRRGDGQRQDAAASGSRSRSGCIDGAGTPLRDALIEIWQADADGLYNIAGRTARRRRSEFYRLGPLPERHGDRASAASRRSSPAACRSATAG